MEESSRQDHKNTPTGKGKEARDSSSRNEGSLVSALALISRVICGRRYAVPEADILDITQEAVLRLWKWSEKFQERSSRMTMAEWDSFTAKTAHNEINRYFSNQLRSNEVPLDEGDLIRSGTPEGNADAELFSLVRNVWQEICSLTLYQRRALLLNSAELLIYLMQFGIDEPAIVASLEINEDDWPDIFGRLPLPDREIAAIARSSKAMRDPDAATRAIGKARFDARRKLKRFRK